MRHPTSDSETGFGLHSGLLSSAPFSCSPLVALVPCRSTSHERPHQEYGPSLPVIACTRSLPVYVHLTAEPPPPPRVSSWITLKRPRMFLLTLVFVFLGSYGVLPLVYHNSLGPGLRLCIERAVATADNESVDIAHLGSHMSEDYPMSPLPFSDSEQQPQQLLPAELLHRVRFQRTKRRLPQCIIVGVRKCGTRALLEFLNLHPQIVKATQEVHFFDEDSKYSLGLEWYRRKMPYSFSNQITVEKSPSYFVTEHVPQRIFAMNPNAKLLLIVREPITRAVSDYTQILANKQVKGKSYGSFESYALTADGGVNVDYKALQISIYANFLRHWFQVFPRRQLHVVDGDQLVVDPLVEIRKIEEFLGLEHRVAKENFYFNKTKGFFCVRNETTEKCLSEAKGRKHPRVADHVVEKLKRFYAPYNEQFFDMVGQNFSWPRPTVHAVE